MNEQLINLLTDSLQKTSVIFGTQIPLPEKITDEIHQHLKSQYGNLHCMFWLAYPYYSFTHEYLKKIKEEATEFELLRSSAADYTLLVKGLPEDYTKEELEKHIYNNFYSTETIHIVNIVPTYDICDYMNFLRIERD